MRLLYACMLLAVLSSPVFSQPVQKWVDDKGKVHYGTPPPGVATQAMTKGTVSTASKNPSRNAAQKSTGTTQPPSGAPSKPGDQYINPQIESLQRELERTQRDNKQR